MSIGRRPQANADEFDKSFIPGSPQIMITPLITLIALFPTPALVYGSISLCSVVALADPGSLRLRHYIAGEVQAWVGQYPV